MLKHLRLVLGILLIVGAITGVAYWEMEGREAVQTERLLVAKETILPGTAIREDLFTVVGVFEENRIEGALTPEDLSSITGLKAKQRIVKNGQIVRAYFRGNDFRLSGEESIYVLHHEWISMRSSSLRRGDWIDIYDTTGIHPLGTYQVAFVKDENDVEVTNQSDAGDNSPLDRLDASSVVDHIEIISDLDHYQTILQQAMYSTSGGLLLVQKGDR